MRKHPFIRLLFLLPLLLCLSAWFYSHFETVGILCQSPEHYWSSYSSRGHIYFFRSDIASRVWSYNLSRYPTSNFRIDPPDLSFLGFNWKSTLGMPTSFIPYQYLSIPYWFLTLLIALTSFLLYRKTRPPLSPATAFPVETSPSPKNP